jgi:lysyl-tRNA synthetase class 2
MQISLEKIRAWALFLSTTRKFFDSKGFIEVTTNHLVDVGAFEATLDCIKASWGSGTGELHTSPEISMKELLTGIDLPIYQLCRAFRDDPLSEIHQREFTMLEYYRPHWDYSEILTLTRDFFESVAERRLDWTEISVNDAFEKYVSIHLRQCGTRDELARALAKNNLVGIKDDDSWEDLFFKVMLDKIEPSLDKTKLTILKDYPPRLCALLKVNESRECVERFEIYWKGMELCNGGTELNNPMTLESRYKMESANRTRAGKTPHPFPARLHSKMKNLPPMAGVAVGMDRLFMCLADLYKTAPR